MSRGRLLVAFAFALAACSSSSSSNGPNLDSNAPLISLSSGDQRTLCDWWAGQYGGYGQSKSCGGGLVQPLAPPFTDQAGCISSLPQKSTSPSCGAKVGNEVGCVEWKLAPGANGGAHGCGTEMQPLDCNALNDTRCH